MFEKFTDRSRKVMAFANQEAHRFSHECVGTEHILLGLVHEGSGVGANVIKQLGMDLRSMRIAVEKLVKSGPDRVEMGRLTQTPRAQKVVEFAIEEARNLKHNYIGTEHLLLGLCRETEGLCCQVLSSFGVAIETVREEVNLLLGVAKVTLDSVPNKVAPFSFRFIDHDNRYELLDSADRVIASKVFDGPVGAYIYNALRKHEASQKLLRDCHEHLKGLDPDIGPPKLEPDCVETRSLIQRIGQLLDS